MGEERPTDVAGWVDRPHKSWELESVGFSVGSNLNWQKEEEDARGSSAVAPRIYNLAVIQAPLPSLLLKLQSARHEILIKECAQ